MTGVVNPAALQLSKEKNTLVCSPFFARDIGYFWFCFFVAFLCWCTWKEKNMFHPLLAQKKTPANTKVATRSSIMFSQNKRSLMFLGGKSKTLRPLPDVQSILHCYHSRVLSIQSGPKDFCSRPDDAQPPPPGPPKKTMIFSADAGVLKNGTPKGVLGEKKGVYCVHFPSTLICP